MKVTRSWFSYAGVLALMLMLLSPVFAQNIRVELDGSPLSFGSVPPASVNGRVLVPLRGVFEALGAQVDYQASSRTVLAAKDATNLRLQIGSSTAYVNGNPVRLDVPAQVVLGRTLVPLRFVSEAMGAQVAWNPATQTVSIASPQSTMPPTNPPPSTPAPTQPPYTPPVNQNTTVNGSVVKLDTNPPATITIQDDKRTQTY
ncbi:MAG: copper amine oxidase N-terminal domain-containing protein, partial [Abditibacteriaceae bacterium]